MKAEINKYNFPAKYLGKAGFYSLKHRGEEDSEQQFNDLTKL